MTRGRPKHATGEKSRALMLEIAAKEFATYGYYETKISAIVKRASLSQPTFYLYFKNKEAIFQELVTLFRTRLTEFAEKSRLQPTLASGTVEDTLISNITALFQFFLSSPDLTRIGLYLSSEATEIKAQLALQIKANLEYEAKAGYFRQDLDMEVVAEALVGMIERLTMTQLLAGIKTPEKLAAEIVKVLLDGMRQIN